MVGRDRVVRRAVHASAALSLAYYAIPDPVPGFGVPKATALLCGVLVVAVIEAVRIGKGWSLSLMRDYERGWVAGYFWLGAGFVAALLLFPERLAVPTILGTALVDPLAGELRPRRGPEAAALAGAFAWAALGALASWIAGTALPPPLLVAGASSALLAEGRKIPRVDDNLLMTLAPLLVMSGLGALLML